MEESASVEKEARVIIIGGSYLSSADVYAVANYFAVVNIDSSVLDKLPSIAGDNVKLKSHRLRSLLLPSLQLSAEEYRASMVVLISKLLTVRSIRKAIPRRICKALNSHTSQEQLGNFEVTDQESIELEMVKEDSALCGIYALLDHQSAALTTLSDAVASLSCDVLNVNVKGFSSLDVKGFSSLDAWKEEENIVASDLKILLEGSKPGGNVETVSEFRNIHAALRKQVKSMQAMTIATLNSGAKGGKSESIAVLALAAALFGLGCSSIGRSNLAIPKGNQQRELRIYIQNLKTEKLITDVDLKSTFRLVQQLAFGEEDLKFANEVRKLLNHVWKIVTWEAFTGFVAMGKKDKALLGQGSVVMARLMETQIEMQILKGDAINAGAAHVSMIVAGVSHDVSVSVIDAGISSILDPTRRRLFTDYLEKIRRMVGEQKILIEGYHKDGTYTINAKNTSYCYYDGEMTMINEDPGKGKKTYKVSYIPFESLPEVEEAFICCKMVSHGHILHPWFYTFNKELQKYLLCYENFDSFLDEEDPPWILSPKSTAIDGQPNDKIQENIWGLSDAFIRLHENGVSHTNDHSNDKQYNYVLCGDKIKMINIDFLKGWETPEQWENVKKKHISNFGDFIAHLLRYEPDSWPERSLFISCLQRRSTKFFKGNKRLQVIRAHPFLMKNAKDIMEVISEAHHVYTSEDGGRRVKKAICLALQQNALDSEFLNSVGVWRPAQMHTVFEKIIKYVPQPQPQPKVATSQPSAVPQQSTSSMTTTVAPDRYDIKSVASLFKFLRNIYEHFADHGMMAIDAYYQIRAHWPSFIAIVHELTT